VTAAIDVAPGPLGSWTAAALDLLFPARCPVCEHTLGERRRDPLCGTCWGSIARLAPPWCGRCGAPGAGPAAAAPALCPSCAAEPPSYDWARAAASYEGTLREALHAFKFRGKRALARPLAALVLEQCGAQLPVGVQALLPVPLARARERERGFNQAALLAEHLGHALGVPVRLRWLVRTRATPPQTELGAEERRANVRDAFAARAGVAGRHVLVIDDVLTTGATAAACATALRGAGARRVGVLTVARVV
jgi:ComF family protein